MFSPLGNAIVEAILKQQADYKDACTKASHFTNKSSTWTPYINGVEHFPKINQALLFSLSPISLSTSSSGGRFLPGRKLSFLYFSSLHNFFSVSALLFGVGNRLPVSINKCTQGFSGHIMRSFFFFFLFYTEIIPHLTHQWSHLSSTASELKGELCDQRVWRNHTWSSSDTLLLLHLIHNKPNKYAYPSSPFHYLISLCLRAFPLRTFLLPLFYSIIVLRQFILN